MFLTSCTFVRYSKVDLTNHENCRSNYEDFHFQIHPSFTETRHVVITGEDKINPAHKMEVIDRYGNFLVKNFTI